MAHAYYRHCKKERPDRRKPGFPKGEQRGDHFTVSLIYPPPPQNDPVKQVNPWPVRGVGVVSIVSASRRKSWGKAVQAGGLVGERSQRKPYQKLARNRGLQGNERSVPRPGRTGERAASRGSPVPIPGTLRRRCVKFNVRYQV